MQCLLLGQQWHITCRTTTKCLEHYVHHVLDVDLVANQCLTYDVANLGRMTLYLSFVAVESVSIYYSDEQKM